MKRVSTILLIVLISFFAIDAHAQHWGVDSIQSLSPKKKKRMGQKLENRKSYYNAVTYYEKYYEAKPEKKSTIDKIAKMHFLLRDYKSAEKWYQLAVDSNLENSPKSRYWLALMQKYNGKYDEAIENFNIFIDRYLADDSEEFHTKANNHIQGCNLGKSQMEEPVRSVIEHLDEKVNNPYSDYSPRIVGDSLLVFSTIRSDSVLDVIALRGQEYHSKIFTSSKSDNGWEESVVIEELKDSKKHVGNAAFSANGKEVYFTVCKTTRNLKTKCCIAMSKKKGKKWSEPEDLSAEINIKKASNTQPTIGVNNDGKEVLYFASNREGGIGGMDIWYSVKEGKDEWGSPVNAGSTINTEQDEATPFYDNTNKTLYFSSIGHINIGGFDAYYAEGSEGQWTNPTSVGYPLNSSTDDLYYVSDDKEENGFFVSNRAGGFSLKSETCCDDIYQYKIIKEITLDGFVASTKDPKTPIGDADVSVFTVHGDDLVLISNFKTGEEEHFMLPLEPDTKYQFNATKTGYWGSEEIIDMVIMQIDDTLRKVFLIEEIVRKKIKLKRIYYNFDRYNLTKAYKVTLDSLYSLMAANDSFTLDIIGHTDFIGKDEYNQKLSRKRAESAADYMMKKGITKDRLTLIAKGESEPIAENETADKKDNPKGRAKNRRVEFNLHTNDPYFEIEIEYEDNEREDTK